MKDSDGGLRRDSLLSLVFLVLRGYSCTCRPKRRGFRGNTVEQKIVYGCTQSKRCNSMRQRSLCALAWRSAPFANCFRPTGGLNVASQNAHARKTCPRFASSTYEGCATLDIHPNIPAAPHKGIRRAQHRAHCPSSTSNQQPLSSTLAPSPHCCIPRSRLPLPFFLNFYAVSFR